MKTNSQGAYFDRNGYVSLWVLKNKPELGSKRDVLKDMCGVDGYDVDFQEAIRDKNWKIQPIESLIQQLSYSDSFCHTAVRAAKSKGIDYARWLLAQFDFAYDPDGVTKPIDPELLFIGFFRYKRKTLSKIQSD